ncbi:Retrovirus-related Pol polyprotein from transposon RE2 [Vitis vinifera]|uniref:Retrovirus-related Pol polyprotein from transposon RE2 n=1 Tax=Vitis vinifera TaxID=29760 RepID=A0A438HAN4_VITVI|nr:Retrovirus-related Pol polyprotein from transposon RE2 [Vitis vinifera]
MTATSTTMGDTSWFLDIGVVHHLTSDLNNLTIHNPFTGGDKVIVGDGKGLSIANIGKFSLASSSGSFVFNDVLHVLSITTNLVSVQRFYSNNGTFIEFHPSHFVVKDQKTRLALLQGKIEKSLYKLPTAPRVFDHPLAFYFTCSTSDAGSLRLRHNRLGHPFVDVVSKILFLCKIPLKHDNNNSVCESCQLAKSHHLPFERFTSRAIKPFGLIHVDLWGATPIVLSMVLDIFSC